MQKVEIYCDESRPDLFTTTSHQKDNYLLIGGLKLLAKHRDSIKESIKNLRKKYNIYSEIKWNKVSRNKIEFYKELIDIFFLFKDNLRFRCIAVEAKKMDIEHFHDNDAELGFYKFYYQLLNHWILDYNNYVVIILIGKKKDGSFKANFITAFVADKSITRILQMPKWVKKLGR
jgi:hypothetical protein